MPIEINTIAAISTTLNDGWGGDERERADIARDVANAINEHCDGGAKAKVWLQYGDSDGEVVVYIDGGSAKGYGRVRINTDGSMTAITHRTSCTNIRQVLAALGAEMI